MKRALTLARRAYGQTSPNPMVGAVLVKNGTVIGEGGHHRAGEPHAEIEALRSAERCGHTSRGATLYVTLEPCCTHGRTPPCTDAIKATGIKRVVVGATDPNPHHAGKGFRILQRAGIDVAKLEPAKDGQRKSIADDCAQLNESFNHWIVHRTPFVTVKAAMTLDGKIATADGESKWITGPKARAYGLKLRRGSDAILVGINTVLADDPALTTHTTGPSRLRRIILDSQARTPLSAQVVTDEFKSLTTIVVAKTAPRKRVEALARHVRVWTAPLRNERIDLRWLLRRLGKEPVTSLLVEGGGEVNASFLAQGHAQRVAFFYAPKILGGRRSLHGVAGEGARSLAEMIRLGSLDWRKLGDDLLLAARVLPAER